MNTVQPTAINKIATHNGAFHADDVFAVATLKMLYPHAEVIRTRNPEIYKNCDIVVDLGEGPFDHHQRGGNGKRENGVPYAAFGLVWKTFGAELTRRFGDESIAPVIDQKIVQGVDALDNGYQPMEPAPSDFDVLTITGAIDAFNPTWNDELTEDEAFFEAVRFAKAILNRMIKQEVANPLAKSIVLDAIENQQNGVVTFDYFIPWWEYLYDAPQGESVLFVLFPDTTSGEWRIQTVPIAPNSFVARKDLPASWAGLRGEALGAVIGINDAVFVHNGRFIGGAVSKESILKMAELALQD